jgi:transcription elongation factor Elf1
MSSKKKFVGDEKLSTGSIIHWAERDLADRTRAMVTCGRCGQRRMTRINGHKGTKYQWTGLCQSCLWHGYRRSDDEKLPSGSIIHWGETRDPNNRRRLMITCGGCGIKRLTSFARRKDANLSYTGLCRSCTKRMYSRDEKISFGSIIHWGERDPADANRAMVTCGLCGKKRMTFVRHGDYARNWTGYCKEHLKGSGLAEIAQKLQLITGNGNSQEKRGAGRPPDQPEHKETAHEQLKARFESVILKLSGELPIHKIKRPAIQKEYQERGELIKDPSTITKRVQLLYGEGISVDDSVALVMKKNRENNSSN